jgi:peptidoglycan/LPS O-acetylase OafA/YrhL
MRRPSIDRHGHLTLSAYLSGGCRSRVFAEAPHATWPPSGMAAQGRGAQRRRPCSTARVGVLYCVLAIREARGSTVQTVMFPKKNNLDWLRLLFAIQVLIVHAAMYLRIWIPEIIPKVPGVPAFFFVSGFLIYASYLNAPGFRYFENRFLRLYPGVLFVTLGGAAVALLAHGGRDFFDRFFAYVTWFIAQTTLGQDYNPQLFRDVGVGVINGSLWTITVEILFYFCVPIIIWMERRLRFTVLTLMGLSFAVYAIGPMVWTDKVYREKTFYDVIALTPVAWGWMFGFGILAVKHFDFIRRWRKYLPLAIIPLAVMMSVGGGGPFFGKSANRLGLFYFASYVALMLWLAFDTPFIRLKFDLSYGIYVWHMPMINLLLVLCLPSVPLAFALTFGIAAISCFLVERPALKLKRYSLKPVQE